MPRRLGEVLDHFAHGAQHAFDRLAPVFFVRGFEFGLEALLGGVKALDDLALILIELAHALPPAETAPRQPPGAGRSWAPMGEDRRWIARKAIPRGTP
jgi:hypothetical protein